MSFNFIPSTADTPYNSQELEEMVELARDLDTLEILVKNDRFYYVTKNEAIKIWILKALNKQTARYEHRAYSNDYGNEITRLFGRQLKNSLLQSELKRYIEETLLSNPYIKRIENFVCSKEGSVVNAEFTVYTVYGRFQQSVNYTNE